jgi:hypothetical protein
MQGHVLCGCCTDNEIIELGKRMVLMEGNLSTHIKIRVINEMENDYKLKCLTIKVV